MKTTTDFREFMSYVDWNELDINEKRALLDAASSITDLDLGLFRSRFIDSLEDKTILEFPMGEIGLALDLNTRRQFIRFLEQTYMKGEYFESYLSTIEEIGKDHDVKTTQIIMLPQKDWKVLKWIQIAIKGKSRLHLATIAYKRDLLDNYKMNPKPENNEMRAFLGYQEEEYPNDLLDDVILETIKNAYAETSRKTKLQLFNTDLAANSRFIQSHLRTNGTIILSSENGNGIRIPINIYCNSFTDMELFANVVFAEVVPNDKWDKDIIPFINTLKTL